MELACWVGRVGGKVAAAIVLEVPERTLYSWLNAERVPDIASAGNIINKSKGLVGLVDIYKAPLVKVHGVKVEWISGANEAAST